MSQITNKFLKQMANSTVKGNFSGATANPTDVTLAAGSGITLTPSGGGSTLTISSSGGGSSTYNASDWTPFTLTWKGEVTDPTLGTTTINKAYWRRDGGDMLIYYELAQSTGGSNGSGKIYFDLPNGVSVDTNVVNYGGFGAGYGPVFGIANISSQGTSWRAAIVSLFDNANPTRIGIYDGGNTIFQSGNALFSIAGYTIQLSARIPIAGWSVNGGGAGTANAVVASAKIPQIGYAGGSGYVAIQNSPNVFVDSNSAINGTTGQWTCPSTGIYSINYTVYMSNGINGGTNGIQFFTTIMKNGVVVPNAYVRNLSFKDSATNQYYLAQSDGISLSLTAGDTIDIAVSFGGTGTFGFEAHYNIVALTAPSATAVSVLAPVGASPNANSATIVGNTLNLQPFNSTNPGVVPASGGGTTNFLRADGTWAAAGGSTKYYLKISANADQVVSGGDILQFNSVNFQQSGSAFNTGTYVWTVPTTGVYVAGLAASFSNATGGTLTNVQFGIELRNSDNSILWGRLDQKITSSWTNGTTASLTGSNLFQWSAGDTVRFRVFQAVNVGSGLTFVGTGSFASQAFFYQIG